MWHAGQFKLTASGALMSATTQPWMDAVVRWPEFPSVLQVVGLHEFKCAARACHHDGRSPSFHTPWQMQGQTKSTASGFIVAPLSARRILTNAHAVAGQVQVTLRKHGGARKYPARVLAVGHEVSCW